MLFRSRLRASWDYSKWSLDIAFSNFSIFLSELYPRLVLEGSVLPTVWGNPFRCAGRSQNGIIMCSGRVAVCYLKFHRVQFKTQLFWLGDDCLDVVYNNLAGAWQGDVIEIANFEFGYQSSKKWLYCETELGRTQWIIIIIIISSIIIY